MEVRGPELELPEPPRAATSGLLCSCTLSEPLWDSIVIPILGKGPGTEGGREKGPFSAPHQH